jgi:hypothetical protein
MDAVKHMLAIAERFDAVTLTQGETAHESACQKLTGGQSHVNF